MPAGRWAASWGSRRTRCAAGRSRRRLTGACGRGPRRRMRRGSGRWSGRTPSCAGSTRSCARRALFSRPSSATGNPGGGLHRGLPGSVRGRAGLPGAAPGGRGDLAVGVLRGPGAAAAGQGGPRRRAGEADPARLEGQRRAVRRLEGLGPAQPRGNRGGPVQRGAADAQAGAARGAPRRVEEATDHGARPVPAQAGGPGEPRLRAGCAGPAVGGRLHLRGHPGGHRLYRVRHRRVRPADRRVAHHRADLVLDALVMAVTYRARQGVKVAGLIHHSDAGAEYLSIRYGAELAGAGIAPSVGTAGDSYDNALAESIVGLYKAEVIDHLGPWETPAQVEAATSEWASWYNTARVMRRTGGRPPAEYEQAWRDGTLGQVPARGPGSRPRRKDEGGGHGRRSLPRRAPPAPAGAPPRAPALLRDGPAGQDGCGGGRASPRRAGEGCRGTPAQVKGASGVARDDAARHP